MSSRAAAHRPDDAAASEEVIARAAVVVAIVLSTAACSKRTIAESGDAAADEAATAAPIATYAATTPERGERTLLEAIPVHQAASNDSAILTQLEAGTPIALEGSYSGWLLIDWPSAPEKTSLGWIQARVDDGRFAVPRDAGAPPPPASARPKSLLTKKR